LKPVVVLATDSREPSGMGEHMLTLAHGLQPRFDTVFACPEGGEGEALLQRAARLGLRIKTLEGSSRVGCSRWLARSGASLLHVHAGIGWEGHELARAGKAAGLPVLRTEHLPYLLTDPIQKAEYRAMLLCVDRRIGVSKAVLDSHAVQDGGPLSLVRNGIGHKPGRPLSPDRRKALGLAADDRLVLTVARFTPQKGHAVLLAAIPAILAHEPRTKFLLVGRGPQQGAIGAQVRNTGLENVVRLLGQRDDVEDLLASSDLFVLPSHFEGLPLALLEAMAHGVPVIASAIGGTVEAIGSDHPYLVPPSDADALATAVIEALGNPARVRGAADTAQARFHAHFSADRMMRETSAIYDAMLDARDMNQ